MQLTQTFLDFRGKTPEERTALIIQRRTQLIEILRFAGDWVLAAELRKHGFSKRELRLIAENDTDAEILSYPGSPGYKLTENATPKDFKRCLSLRSEAKKLMRRFIRYQRKFHAAGI